jgi:hypothetical protein
VELRQVEDPAQWLAMFAVNHGRLAAERAARRLEAGELVLVQAYSFIEFVADGQDGRFYGPEFGAREGPIRARG